MLELKVEKIGDALGIVLPKEVVDRLGAADGEAILLIESPDGSYRLALYDAEFKEKMAKAEDIMSRYRNTLNILAQ